MATPPLRLRAAASDVQPICRAAAGGDLQHGGDLRRAPPFRMRRATPDGSRVVVLVVLVVLLVLVAGGGGHRAVAIGVGVAIRLQSSVSGRVGAAARVATRQRRGRQRHGGRAVRLPRARAMRCARRGAPGRSAPLRRRMCCCMRARTACRTRCSSLPPTATRATPRAGLPRGAVVVSGAAALRLTFEREEGGEVPAGANARVAHRCRPGLRRRQRRRRAAGVGARAQRQRRDRPSAGGVRARARQPARTRSHRRVPPGRGRRRVRRRRCATRAGSRALGSTATRAGRTAATLRFTRATTPRSTRRAQLLEPELPGGPPLE